jgi:HK97 family phage portal protein
MLTRFFGSKEIKKKSTQDHLYHPIGVIRDGSPTKYSKKDMYKGVVFSCIDAIAESVSKASYATYVRDKDGELVHVPHPVIDLLKRPDPFFTGKDLFYLISSQLETHGNVFLFVERLGNKPTGLIPLDPDRTHIVKDAQGRVTGYVFKTASGKKVPLELDQVVPILKPNPFNPYRGISTLQMASAETEERLDSQNFNRVFFKNGAKLSGVLTTDEELSNEAYQRLKNEFRIQYEGSGNAHKNLILEGGLKYSPIAVSQKDMDFVAQRRISRDDILSIFRVPKAILAISDDVNRANAKEARAVFAESVIEPRMLLIFDKLNAFLLPLFKDKQLVELVFDSPVPEDTAAKLQWFDKGVDRWITRNEARQEMGKDPVENGDFLYINGTQAPITSEDPARSDTEEVVVEPEQEDEDDNPTAEKALNKLFKSMAVTKGVEDMADRLIATRENYIEEKKRAFSNKLKVHFAFLLRDIKKSFKTKDGTMAAFDAVVGNTNEWKALLADIILSFATDAAKEAANNVGSTYNMPVDFSLQNKDAIAWLREQAKKSSESVTNTTLDKARKVIADALENDKLSIEELKKLVAKELNTTVDYRIERIVRNELANAYAYGNRYAYKSSGIVEKTEWVTAEDDRVCPICYPNHGKIRAFDESFPSAHFHEPAHIMCRCVTVPIFDDPMPLDFHDSEVSKSVFNFDKLGDDLNGGAKSIFDHQFPDHKGFTDNFNWSIKKFAIDDVNVHVAGSVSKVDKFKSEMASGSKFPAIFAIKIGDDIEVIDGAHRFQALKELGATDIYLVLGKAK